MTKQTQKMEAPAFATRGRIFEGTVISSKMNKTVTVEWKWKQFIKKYERYEQGKTRIKAHNPESMNAVEGDIVQIKETRPISKTKHFTIIKVLGKERGFQQRMEAEQEAKQVKPKAEKKEEQAEDKE